MTAEGGEGTSDGPLEAPEVIDAELVEEIAGRAGEQAAFKVVSSHWSAPLPPPEAMQGYENVLPGLADRIVSMAEREAQHRHNMDQQLVATDSKTRTRAQIFALVIGLAAIGVAGALGLTGHPFAGLGTLLIGLAPIIGSFLTGQLQRRPERPELPPPETPPSPEPEPEADDKT